MLYLRYQYCNEILSFVIVFARGEDLSALMENDKTTNRLIKPDRCRINGDSARSYQVHGEKYAAAVLFQPIENIVYAKTRSLAGFFFSSRYRSIVRTRYMHASSFGLPACSLGAMRHTLLPGRQTRSCFRRGTVSKEESSATRNPAGERAQFSFNPLTRQRRMDVKHALLKPGKPGTFRDCGKYRKWLTVNGDVAPRCVSGIVEIIWNRR